MSTKLREDDIPEFKVTPEMIDAGAEIAWRTPIMEPDEAIIRQMVAEVFQAMLRARPTRPS